MIPGKTYAFTDGGAKPNPGPGGWAFAIIKNHKLIASRKGRNQRTTNNRMELEAIISVLEHAYQNSIKLDFIYSDSTYCVNGASKWMHGWKKKNWMKGGELIPNADLWQEVYSIFPKGLQIKHVKAHNGNKWNEYVDAMTRD